MPENKFKAGDRLVAKHNISGIRAGDVVVVKERAAASENYAWVHIVGHRDYTSDGSFKEDNFELWQPKVGDRVRAKDRGWEDSAGEGFIRKVDGSYLVEFADGWCRGHNGDLGDDKENRWWHTLDELEPLPVAAEAQPAADASATLKIEAGRYYKTRDGRKVGPMRERTWGWAGDIIGGDAGNVFRKDGEHGNFLFSNRPELDLIAEWVEPAAKPIVAATVDYQADEYGSGVKAEPRFKVGDFVTARSQFGSEHRGRITEVDHTDNWLTYRLDDRDTWVTADSVQLVANDNAPVAEQPAPAKFKVGDRVRVARCDAGKVDYVGQFGNVTGVDIGGRRSIVVKIDGDIDLHFSAGELELAPAPWSGYGARNPTAIVARIDNGQPRPNPRPFVHHSQEAAAKEAARLAGVYKGHKFGVYVLTGEPAVVERTYEHEWQRLAANGKKIDAIRVMRAQTGLHLRGAKLAVEDWLAAA